MKLFTKYSRVNSVASILTLLLGSIGYYFIIRSVLIHQLDDTLKIEEAEILDFVHTRDKLPEPANYRDQQIRFTPSPTPVPRKFIHSTWEAPNELRHPHREPVRQLVFSVTAEGRNYNVSVGKSEEETEDLLQWIMVITAGLILLLLGILFLANRLLLRRIWLPFYSTLEAIRQFNLSSRKPLPVSNTGVDEFIELDRAAQQMTGKILKDYEMLKNFAGDASHEMQTPLAIINAKLDLIIQDPGLEEKHLRQLQAMYDAVGRLSKLNQSLLLLTRIENNQFTHTEPVEMLPLIEEKLLLFEDQIRARGLAMVTELDRLSVPMNSYLADILLNNLLLNAIRHNQDGGSIHVGLREQALRISNTGPGLQLEPATLFDRFTKGPQSRGTGLGLAIVRQICDNYGFSSSYSYNDNRHTILIYFQPVAGFPALQNFPKKQE
jgi:signal transduction histidine kinase